jgi:uncharacterized protein
MSRAVHFELPADDPRRAIAFYENVFGWTVTDWEVPMDYWLVTTGPDDEPGINGAKTPRMTAEQATTCSMSRTSVDESAKKVVDADGSVIMPKGPVPGVGYLIMCKKTEGNVFGIIEADPSANKICRVQWTRETIYEDQDYCRTWKTGAHHHPRV